MKIATWNLDTSNQGQSNAIDFLLEQRVDIACLQELRWDTIKYLETLKQFQLHYCVSYRKNKKKVFSAILSRAPIKNPKIYRFYSSRHTLLSWATGRDLHESFFHFFDYTIGRQTLRVFNIHLPSVVSPSYRHILLRQIFKRLHSDSNVVCGDFNSFGHFPWNFLMGPLNGSNWKDYIRNELQVLQRIIKEYNLKLSASSIITHPRFRTHIDHIMVPDGWLKFFPHTFEDRFGSDHKLFIIEETETERLYAKQRY